MMCVVIVSCNLAVMSALCRLSPTGAKPRRTTVSRDHRELAFNHTTQEELSFAKLMVVLCVFFVICWLPQMDSFCRQLSSLPRRTRPQEPPFLQNRRHLHSPQLHPGPHRLRTLPQTSQEGLEAVAEAPLPPVLDTAGHVQLHRIQQPRHQGERALPAGQDAGPATQQGGLTRQHIAKFV
ncbi:g_PROTEIN_RECEP_F1_2 domain-containing protein [Caerostris extrusa]|uniref:G_PROTEIN_RECEP_F1_2 domain-containing protein n=1 Tax=Caerostris extrusa TaxID=172846 RepID=A0AAV4P4W9_CAEEX|nr:g_PROTEIN_RECEP_F1_2 domain-containing protein [Caerostris extrusa]